MRAHLRRSLWTSALLLALFVPAAAQAPGGARVALVIGNAAYPMGALANPVNDAKAIADTLRRLGFTVIEVHDADRAGMLAAIDTMSSALRGKSGVGLLYYAGHGLQLDWRNYMVPVDSRLASAADVAQQTVDVQAVLEAFRSSGTQVNIVVLDACRDNPFSAAGASKGLAQMDAPPRTLLAYATAPGNVAEDGDGKNPHGLYTEHLLEEMVRPSAGIEDVFKRVRLKVRQASDGKQIPWEATSLEEDFRFDISRAQPPIGTAALPDFAEQSAAWVRIKDSSNVKDFYEFLERYPTGEVSEAALERLNTLAKPQITAAVGKGQSATLAYSGPTLLVGDAYTFRIYDGFTNRPVRDLTRKVVSIRNGVVQLSIVGGGLASYRLTLLGGTIDRTDARGKTIRFDPPMEPNPAEYYVGKRIDGQSTSTDADGHKVTTTLSSKIVGTERIVLAAGTFDTYVIEATLRDSEGGYQVVRKWVDPRYGMALKREVIERRGREIVRNERRELIALQAIRQ